MAKCTYSHISNKGTEIWRTTNGKNWILDGVKDIRSNMIAFSKKAFKGKYKNKWIVPIYFDDKYIRYTDKFFSEVGVALFPQLTNVRKELANNPNRNTGELVKEIAKEDIQRSINNDIEPIKVVIRGVTIPGERYGEYINRIKSVQEVEYFEDLESSNTIEI